MNVWKHIPLLKFLVPFIIGILVSTSNCISINWVISLFAASLFALILIHFILKRRLVHLLIRLGSILALWLFFLSGVILTHYYKDNNYHNHFSSHLSSEWLKVWVINQPQIKEKVISCKVMVIESLGEGKKLQGKAQVYFKRDSQSFKIKYGDQLIIKNRLQEIKDPKNQHQFNFRKFYNNQNIYHQGFFNHSQWVRLNQNTSNGLLSMGYSWQLELRKLFNKYFEDDAVRGVAEAVIFGFKEDLDEDWLKAFSKTGTIHVLAVSGLHVGIIYVLMSFLLGISKSRGVSLVVKSSGILIVLFLYALLTGFSPSVSRASIMFGTVIIGNSFNRQSSIYNSLCLACFILLVFNPLNIYNVGFQFSFLAVLGIVYFKDDIRGLFPEASYFFDKIFILLSVSIAAQIATFPLGLFYFHQYPNLFMFSNLIVIPCISIVLYLGVIFILIVPFSNSLGEIISDVIGIYIQFIADAVNSIQNIPFAFFEGVYITKIQMILLYLLIIVISLSVKYRWKTGLMFTIVCVVMFIFNDWFYLNKIRQNEVVVFDVGKGSLVGFKRDNHINFIMSDNLFKDEKKMEYSIKPYLIANRMDKQYSIFPASLSHTKVNLKNIKLLGNGAVWFDGNAYRINTDTYRVKRYK